MKRFLSASLLFIVSVMAHGAEGKNTKAEPAPVDKFKAITQREMSACSAIATPISPQASEMEKIAAYEPRKACILAGHGRARKAFPDALKQVENNPAASELLKSFFNAWLGAFDNVGQGGKETAEQYQKRSAADRAKYEAIWKRFKKEAAAGK